MVAEIFEAIDRERATKTQKLFPVRIDDYILSAELEEVAKVKVSTGEWRDNWVSYVRACITFRIFHSWKNKRKIEKRAGERLIEASSPSCRTLTDKSAQPHLSGTSSLPSGRRMRIYGNPLSSACEKTKTLVRLCGRLKAKDSRRGIKPRVSSVYNASEGGSISLTTTLFVFALWKGYAFPMPLAGVCHRWELLVFWITIILLIIWLRVFCGGFPVTS